MVSNTIHNAVWIVVVVGCGTHITPRWGLRLQRRLLGSPWCRTGQIISALHPEIMPGTIYPQGTRPVGRRHSEEWPPYVRVIGPALPRENWDPGSFQYNELYVHTWLGHHVWGIVLQDANSRNEGSWCHIIDLRCGVLCYSCLFLIITRVMIVLLIQSTIILLEFDVVQYPCS